MSVQDWMAKLNDYVEATAPKDFVGRVEVNVFQGSVSNINVTQSYKKNKK